MREALRRDLGCGQPLPIPLHTCFTRQRYGTKYCDAERLPAEELYAAVLDAGTLSEAKCGKRLEGLATKVRDLRQRREELVVAVQQASATAPDADEIAEMRHHIEKAITNGAVSARKALLQVLVHEIRVEGRDRVVPWFRVPGGADPKVRAAWHDRRPRQDSNLRTRLRRPALYPLSYGGDSALVWRRYASLSGSAPSGLWAARPCAH